MKKVIILRGLQGSGKTTWAIQHMRENPGKYKRVSTDDLRGMLDGGKHTQHNESFMLQTRNALILAALDDGKSVIVDSTGLNPVHERDIRELVKGRGVQVVIQDFTDVPIEQCIANDLVRYDSVGEQVIRETYNKWLRKTPRLREASPGLLTAILVDIDGTLAWKGDRDVYDASKAYLDTPNPAVVSVIEGMASGDVVGTPVVVIVMSGRQEKDRAVTVDWLLTHNIRYDALYMRSTGDTRKDSVVKQELYETYVEGRYNVLFVLDDRQQVVDMWRRLGLQTWQVQEGRY